jgi:hypothetical protein
MIKKAMAPNIHPEEKIKGYPRLASQIELRPDLAIFRRFGSLNAENLLYFQAELTMLERDLHDQQLEDHSSGHSRKSKYALSWYQLESSGLDGDERQLQLVFRMREVLKQYSMLSTK